MTIVFNIALPILLVIVAVVIVGVGVIYEGLRARTFHVVEAQVEFESKV